ncbi:MAG: NAD(P)H-hydrate epimerase [Candidatus Omnitrophica bacterium]|nr:NAD(P)H-hydrate epimerase [Candidatus Omnitrophota bacterium]
MKRVILTREQLYEKERQAYEQFLIPPLILMENAGRQTAIEVANIVKKNDRAKVVVIAGPGNNGGDGMVAARYLHCWGISVSVLLTFEPEKIKEPAFTNYKILVKMNLICHDREILWNRLENVDVVVDAIFGIGLTRNVGGKEKEAIDAINKAGKYVISVDIPSGLDANTGEVYGIAVKANQTITFGFGKKGLFTKKGRYYAGKIKIVDIGYPPELYE